MPSEKISVTIITHNEEASIGRALQSASWADEIVVVDSMSTDRTAEICRERGARVIRHPWEGYAPQKNRAISLASHDWIFSLDADERVTPALAEEIRKEMTEGPRREGYYIPRKNFFRGRWIRHGGWWPDYTLRLFDRRRGKFAERLVHETVILEGRAGYLDHPLEHFTYDSIEDFLARAQNYSRLAAQEMALQGKSERLADLLFRPPATFIRMYLLKGGFRDGRDGFILAMLYSYYTFLKYARLGERGRPGDEGV